MISTRRDFLGLGTGLVTLGLGTALGGRSSWALPFDVDLDQLSFGELEPLAALIQETEPGRLQALLIERLQTDKLDLRTLVAATALANARTFGGEDYIGYHCQMALMPAYEMAQQLPAKAQPLPVLKVVYRTADQIQAHGGRAGEVLRRVFEPDAPEPGVPEPDKGTRAEASDRLRQALYAHDVDAAERAFASLSQGTPREAYDDLQSILLENLDVHRVVLSWRAWELLPVTGERNAHTLMRQSVRFCIQAEKRRVERGRPQPRLRTLLPELIEECRLAETPAGERRASDAELEELTKVVFRSDKEQAARALAAALADGLSHHDAGEALSLAANHLLLHDPGRSRDEPGKPKGSVHGASVGVHAADSARAWRNIAGVTNRRNAAANLIAGAYHTAGQSGYVGRSPWDYEKYLGEFEGKDADKLLLRTAAAVEEGNQPCAAAAAHAYMERGLPERALFDLLLGYGVSQDGALHAEKFYRTVCEEIAAARPACRTRHVVALARVTASEYGWPAPGLDEARERLGV